MRERNEAAVQPSGPAVAGATAAAMTVAVAQLAPALRDATGNAGRIVEVVRRARADLVVTPELSLTGYDLGDSVHRLARPVSHGAVVAGFEGLSAESETLVGMVERDVGGPFNSAVLLGAGGEVMYRHRKIYLPTYGMFDEGRWFGRGSALEPFELLSGWRIGVLICEDFWHPGLVYVLASRGIDVLVVQAAAPARGVWEGGYAGGFGSADVWERIARTTAQLYSIYVVLANRSGVEGGVTFAGNSLIVGPDGIVVARAPHEGEALLTATLSRRTVERARVPYSHARDDMPALVAAALRRDLEGK
jgi:NAD+ synthase (glutamine-hydrolysing)